MKAGNDIDVPQGREMAYQVNEKSIVGSLLGTAIGDAIGLSCEGMSKRRQKKMFGLIDGYHFFFGRGMVSDDTEHHCMVAQSLIVSGGDEKIFVRSLGWRLRFWFLGLPAGIGFATLRAILKLWLGFSGAKSGVYSAGNGPAMRCGVIGACYGRNIEQMRVLVRASTRITHKDRKAEFGSLAVAIAASMAGRSDKEILPVEYLSELQKVLARDDAEEFLSLMSKTIKSVEDGQDTASFAASIGIEKGVTGYMYHTIPVVIHTWLRNQSDFRVAIREVVHCGGDTDTTAAILGGIVGATVGKEGIPQEWLDGLWEWPRSVGWIENLGKRLSESIVKGQPLQAPRLPFWKILPRNLFFLLVVLAHGFRRLLPPY